MTEPVKTSRLPARLRNMNPRERTLAIVLGVMVVAAVIFLLLSGGGGPTRFETSPPVIRTSPTPTAGSTTPPETGQAFEGKDPFQPLAFAAAPGPAGTPVPTPTGSVTGVNGGGGTTSAMTVTLLDVRKSGGKLVATVEVDGKDYNVSEGQTFATN